MPNKLVSCILYQLQNNASWLTKMGHGLSDHRNQRILGIISTGLPLRYLILASQL